jgi:cytochrome c biogenesis protein CcmG/thiol:disulfide interchange protein DsbE
MNEALSNQVAEEKPKRKRLNMSVILVGITVLAILGMAGFGLVKAQEGRPEPGATAPPFDFAFFDGYEWEEQEAVNLEDMRGQIVILNFWASWCIECRDETTVFENAWRRYRDDDVVFVGVAYVDVEPNSIAYLDEFDVTFPNAPDLRSGISKLYNVTGVPETFVLDRQGTIRHVKIGPYREAELNQIINDLLAEES